MDEPRTQPLPPVKILVVDDHPNTATMLARGIAQLGSRVDVASASSGQQALGHADRGAIDILITDMIMPDMTGLELIEKLQTHSSGRPIFSYLITAYDVPGLKVSARRLKVRDVIIKPVHPERICQIVLQAMDEMDHARPVVVNETPQVQPFTILIADDQPDNLMLLSRYLEKEGYSYIKAKDGLETLEKTRHYMPDLILLDVNMPNKDGFAVLEEIRADPATEHIPVIILTAAKVDPVQIQSGLNMGADDYVLKPFDRRELLARIRTKLRVKQAEDVIRRRNRELNLLPEIGKELSARFNIDELATILLKRTGETLGAMMGHIVLLNPEGSYEKTLYFDRSSELNTSPAYKLPHRLLEIANDAHQGFIVNDTHDDAHWSPIENDQARSAVVVPMFGRYHLLGLLLLTNEQINYFKLEHLLLLQAICSQASIAIENAQLYDKMAQEQQRLAAVLQGAADAILMFDNEDRLSMVNPAAQRLFTDYQMIVGQQLIPGKGYDELIALLSEMRSSGAALSQEISWPDRRVFSTALTPVKEGGCVVVLHDVSRFKELEKVKDEFIATASHDLRNPITAIGGYSQLIGQAGPLNEMQLDFVQRIDNATTNMQELVENMMNLARMDLHADSRHEILNVGRLVAEIGYEFQPQAKAKRQILTFDTTMVVAEVQGDPLQLRQALRNLIGNAIKYTPERGAITVTLVKEASSVRVLVRDTGYGIPAADLPHIFERFYRVRNNGHDEIEGNGLGLAIVQSIAESHGGAVAIESEVGKGSCFSMTLPLISCEAMQIALGEKQ